MGLWSMYWNSIDTGSISANETTLHPNNNLYKVTIIGQCTAFKTEPWLTPNKKL